MIDIEATPGCLLYVDPTETVHWLSNPDWSPEPIPFVDRHALAARLRALADVIDPGSFDVYLLRVQAMTGAQSVTRP